MVELLHQVRHGRNPSKDKITPVSTFLFHKQLVKCLHNEGSAKSLPLLLGCLPRVMERSATRTMPPSDRRSYVTNAVQPLCDSLFAAVLMCGVRLCVEEGGLLVDLLFGTRARLS